MSFQVNVNIGTRPSPSVVSAGRVVQEARRTCAPNAAQAVAVTVPICRVNQTALQYEQRVNSGRREFRFQTGTLQLTLRQSVYIANNISSCAQNIWADHEQEHVRDNQSLMSRMERPIKAHRSLRTIFIAPEWRPTSQFNTIQATIQSTVGDIFRDLTRDAVNARDTSSVYTEIRNRIARNCGTP